MAKKTIEQIRAELDELNQKMSERQHISDSQIIAHEFVGKKLSGRSRPEHSIKLKGKLLGNENPATRPEVKEKIKQAALSQSKERSKRVSGSNNPATRPEVKEKIKQARTLQIMVPKYFYIMESPRGKIFEGTSIKEMVALTGIPFEAIKYYMMKNENPEKGPNLGWKFKKVKNEKVH